MGSITQPAAGAVSAAAITAALGYTPANPANVVAKAGDTMTGPLHLPAGTVTEPSLTVGQEDTGLYAPAPGHPALSAAGVLKLELDNAGLIVPNAIRFGQGQSTSPGLFWTSTRILVQVGDQSSDAEISARVVDHRPVLVADLPTPTAFYNGAQMVVTDSGVQYVAANVSTPVTGGGSNITPVYCDGSTWRVG